jgi:hypothetical protein
MKVAGRKLSLIKLSSRMGAFFPGNAKLGRQRVLNPFDRFIG